MHSCKWLSQWSLGKGRVLPSPTSKHPGSWNRMAFSSKFQDLITLLSEKSSPVWDEWHITCMNTQIRPQTEPWSFSPQLLINLNSFMVSAYPTSTLNSNQNSNMCFIIYTTGTKLKFKCTFTLHVQYAVCKTLESFASSVTLDKMSSILSHDISPPLYITLNQQIAINAV